jgi:hypothetical protein
VTIKAVIHNTGSRGIAAGGKVALVQHTLDSFPNETVLAELPLGSLGAGTSTTLSFPIRRPALANHHYVVRVTPQADVVETNMLDNEAVLGAGLAITTLPTRYDAPGGAAVEARVRVTGAVPPAGSVTATLTLDDPDGPRVGETTITFPETPTDTLVLREWLDATELGSGRHQIYWNLDPVETLGEAERGDNIAATTVNILPDLTTRSDMVSFGRAPGAAAPFRMLLRNAGNWSSSGGVVEIFDGVPGQPGVRSLGRIALPTVKANTVVTVEGTLNLAGTPAATTGLGSIYIRIDPGNVVAELNENNNLVRIGGTLGGAVPGARPQTLYLPLVAR